jgi:hypothetical protein
MFVAPLLVLAVACNSGGHRSAPAPSNAMPNARTSSVSSAALADVGGIPLPRLAHLARSEAATWSETHPFNLRVALGSDRAANALMGQHAMTYNFGSLSRAYVVVLDGRFSCRAPRCEVSVFAVTPLATTTSTVASGVPVSTMVLTVDPVTLELTGLRVIDHQVDLSVLGKTYPLGD